MGSLGGRHLLLDPVQLGAGRSQPVLPLVAQRPGGGRGTGQRGDRLFGVVHGGFGDRERIGDQCLGEGVELLFHLGALDPADVRSTAARARASRGTSSSHAAPTRLTTSRAGRRRPT